MPISIISMVTNKNKYKQNIFITIAVYRGEFYSHTGILRDH